MDSPDQHLRESATSGGEQGDTSSLTRRMIQGDEAAYREFHGAYFHRLSRYLLVVAAGDEEAARDALQDTFRRVVRHIRRFADEAVLWSWLTVVARSAYRDHQRKRRRYLAFLDRFARHAEIAAAEPGSDSEARLHELLAGGLAQLSSEERELLERKYTARQTVQAIAAQLNITEKAVESRLARIRLRLKAGIVAALKNEGAR